VILVHINGLACYPPALLKTGNEIVLTSSCRKAEIMSTTREPCMKFQRRFTSAGKDLYQSVRYEKRASVLRKSGDGAPVKLEVEVPEFWSQTATDILAQKYFRRKDVPQFTADGKPVLDAEGKQVKAGETSVKQVVDRLASCWRHWGEELGFFDKKEDAQAFYDETAYMLLHQMAAPNSPQWFNTGLAHRYGITGSAQGHFYVDPADDQVKHSDDAYTRPQPHACFIQGVKDDLLGDGGIYSLLTREGRIFKYGSGTGTNFSAVRSAGEPLGGGGTSSGLMSFLRVFDRAAGAIKSGGTTRRAAKMVCLDMDHPEIEEFITWKTREEAKVAALVTGSKALAEIDKRIQPRSSGFGGLEAEVEADVPPAVLEKMAALKRQGTSLGPWEVLDTHFEGEAYNTVSGQNSNNSVRIPNLFMKAVADNGDWHLTSRSDGSVRKIVKARHLWELIGICAWDCADPGMQYHDTINEWHTCPNDGPIRASNPCSEYMFLDDTACNLASLNLVRFQDADGRLKIEEFEHAVRLWTVVLEISVGMAQFPSPEIARKSYDYRTLGLGYANLGAFLMRAGLAYDSAPAAEVTAAITALLGGISYATSAEMAKALGAFPRYEANKQGMLRVMRNHRHAAHGETSFEGLTVKPLALTGRYCEEPLVAAARRAWDAALALGEKHGYRNAQVTVLAPTGTIGLLMDCDTTGIEPDFALVKFKKLSGGGYFKIVNRSLPVALRRLGYDQAEQETIERYCLGSGSLENAPHINRHTLAERGFTPEKIQSVEKALPLALSLEDAFHPLTLGHDFLKSLGISDEVANGAGADVLAALGFNEDAIDAADRAICGAQMVEGAPHLKPEHYSVFDCASRCGKGERVIAPLGHLRIMAAAQPFISGAISKTVNLPNEYTVADIHGIYKQGFEWMLKAVAVYRDGCKLSQPLNVKASKPKKVAQQAATIASSTQATVTAASLLAPALDALPSPLRRRLPTRRGGFVQELAVEGHKLFLRTGEYPDGSLGEIFIDMYKEGAAYRSILNCFAVLTSKALQYGIPLEELVDTFTFTRFEPSGPVEGHENIKNCTSILDLIFRIVGFHYLGNTDFVHVKPVTLQSEDAGPAVAGADRNPSVTQAITQENPERALKPVGISGTPQPLKHPQTQASSAQSAAMLGRKAGYTGQSCSSCSSMRVRRNGTCIVCDDCGTTSGCS
jgi:ribonucleoside-diphosphate reductase alpha chain